MKTKVRQLSIADTLLQRIENSEESLHHIATESGVSYAILYRFVHRTRPNITIETAQKLADHFGLSLR